MEVGGLGRTSGPQLPVKREDRLTVNQGTRPFGGSRPGLTLEGDVYVVILVPEGPGLCRRVRIGQEVNGFLPQETGGQRPGKEALGPAGLPRPVRAVEEGE